MGAVRVVVSERGEAGLVDVVDERRFVIHDIAIEQVAAHESVGRGGVDGFVVGQQRPAKGRQAQQDPQGEDSEDKSPARPHVRSRRFCCLCALSWHVALPGSPLLSPVQRRSVASPPTHLKGQTVMVRRVGRAAFAPPSDAVGVTMAFGEV